MSYSLNSVKGDYIGDYIGNYYSGYKGDARSLDSSSNGLSCSSSFRKRRHIAGEAAQDGLFVPADLSPETSPVE